MRIDGFPPGSEKVREFEKRTRTRDPHPQIDRKIRANPKELLEDTSRLGYLPAFSCAASAVLYPKFGETPYALG